MSTPIPIPNIDAVIAYILANWNQNNNQLITGQIGQNVVWNLAELIKKNPENWEQATVVATNLNYTTQSSECIVIFTNNSSGGLDFVDNIWFKWYFVNETNNDRLFLNGKSYIDINGATVTKVKARTVVTIAKGEDDNWYQIDNTGATSQLTTKAIDITFVVGQVSTNPLFNDGQTSFSFNIGVNSVFDITVGNCNLSVSVDQSSNPRNTVGYIGTNYVSWSVVYTSATGVVQITMNQAASNGQLYQIKGSYQSV